MPHRVLPHLFHQKPALHQRIDCLYGGLQQPSIPIPADITKLTGITDEMVAGQAIDMAALEQLIAPADLIIAHNAPFDRFKA